MKKLFVIILAFLVFSVHNSYAQTPTSYPFKSGELLQYIVSYKIGFLNFDVALATLKIEDDKLNDKETFKLTIKLITAPAYEHFFYMNDIYTIWLEKDKLLPLQILNDNHEGDYRFHSEYYFDWNTQQVTTKYYSNNKPEEKTVTYALKSNSRDAFSMFYYLRTMPFEQRLNSKGEELELVFYDKLRTVKYTYVKSEKDRVRGHGANLMHKFKCTLALANGGGYDEGNEFELWFPDKNKDSKIPTFIYSPIKVGSIRARLATPQGLERFYK